MRAKAGYIKAALKFGKRGDFQLENKFSELLQTVKGMQEGFIIQFVVLEMLLIGGVFIPIHNFYFPLHIVALSLLGSSWFVMARAWKKSLKIIKEN